MRNFLTTLLIVTIALSTFAQAPQKMTYQTVVRDGSNELVTNTTLGMQISILQGSETGTEVYVELQSPVTNDNGLATVEIGTGTVLLGSIEAIDWSSGPYFIKSEIDPAAGANYTINGVNQILSVPYAFHVETAGSLLDGSESGELLYWDGSEWIIIPPPGYNDLALVYCNGRLIWGQCGTCDDGKKNGSEEEIDCGGPDCPPCIYHCGDGIQNGSETDIDCGGPDCGPCPTGSVTDASGNTYGTIMIGDQEWMTENLRTDQYCSGEAIPNVTDATEWVYLTTGGWSYYDNDSAYEHPYGKLYNWYGVDDVRNICPCEWHVPGDDEWKMLEMELGMSQAAADGLGSRGTDEGGKIKEAGIVHWQAPNTGATNSSGFSGLPGGSRDDAAGFPPFGFDGYWWSATEDEGSANHALSRYLHYQDAFVYRFPYYKETGFSIRCVKDNCNDGIQNGNETGVDCGGPDCSDCPGTFYDYRDGQTYQLVTVGTQEWFAENLNYTAQNSWCYADIASNCNTYGRLYHWVTATNVCPSGSHLPSDSEWTTLTDYLGGNVVAGGKMKSTGTIEAGTGLWHDPNTGATNESGFTGLPGGNRFSFIFYDLGDFGSWWSATESDANSAWAGPGLQPHYDDQEQLQ